MAKDDIITDAIGMLLNDRMNKKAVIERILGKPLTIKPCESGGYHYVILPVSIQNTYGLKKRITASSEDALIDRLFDNLIQKPKEKAATLADIYERWIKEREADTDTSPRTIRDYRDNWRKYLENYDISKTPLSEITPSILKDHFKEVTKNRSMTRKAFGNLKTLTNFLWDYAYDHELCSDSISRKISRDGLKFAPRKSKAYMVYTPDERARICDFLEESDDPIDLCIVLFFTLIARAGEIKALWWEDIDFERHEIYIHKEYVDEFIKSEDTEDIYAGLKWHTKSGENEGNRVVPMSERAERVLKKVKKIHDEYVFLYDGQVLKTQTINSHIERACDQLGIRYLSTHKIRATNASTAAQTMGIGPAAYMGGWKNMRTLDNYLNSSRMGNEYKEQYRETFN